LVVADSRAPGLRVQILLALAGLMLLAFVPLFFAVASVTRTTLLDAREQGARALGRTVAAHLGEVRARADGAELARVLESHVGHGGVEAACVWGPAGEREACAGSPADEEAIPRPSPPYREGDTRVRGALGRALDVMVPVGEAVVVARLRTDDDADRAAPLVRLVALYMITFALALLTFAYFALTRLIVKPLDALVRAADRVASGSRFLAVPRAGASELSELGLSLQTMTERRLREEDALRAKVHELTLTTARLTEAQRQLVRSEQMASVGRLSAGLAHEIGNPLAAILGMEDLLIDGGLPADEQRDFLVRMKRETERISGVLRDLLDFARPEQGATSVQAPAPPADVATVARDVFALVRVQKPFKKVNVALNVGSAVPVQVALSPQRLTQVLLNVLLNAGAAIASRPGGAQERDLVTVRVQRQGESARIEVEDTGPGIPESMRERVFEPFVTTKDVGEGTGLGLAVCRGVVEAAGGTIAVDASYAGGARVVIEIPLAKG
jgi:two-component system NtrC family sensor kinase